MSEFLTDFVGTFIGLNLAMALHHWLRSLIRRRKTRRTEARATVPKPKTTTADPGLTEKDKWGMS